MYVFVCSWRRSLLVEEVLSVFGEASSSVVCSLCARLLSLVAESSPSLLGAHLQSLLDVALGWLLHQKCSSKLRNTLHQLIAHCNLIWNVHQVLYSLASAFVGAD